MKELYYENNKMKKAETVVKSVFEENGKNCVKFEQDLFYPKGGGQKGDRGMIIWGNNQYKVLDTVKDEYSSGSLVITDELLPDDCIGNQVECILDWDFRFSQMKLHTCLHLHHCILEEVLGSKIEYPSTAAIEDGFAYNKYPSSAFDKDIIESANKKFLELLKEDVPVITYPDDQKEGYRWWECRGTKIPCGGIHVNNLNEIGYVDIKTSSKKGSVTIKFIL